jgi:hypothetical protein
VVATLDFVMTQGPPYPDRIHQSVLIMDLVLRVNEAVIEWADLTEDSVRGWPDLKPDEAMRAAAMDLVHELHQRATAVAGRHVDTRRESSMLTV